MKQYTVEITDGALGDMESLYNHIAYVLLSPENAMGQYNRIAEAILKLKREPFCANIILKMGNTERGYGTCSLISTGI